MIAAVGDLMLDIFLLSELQEEEQNRGILLRPGGSAANTAAWAAQLGIPCAFAGCVGQDGPGHMLVDDLLARGVEVYARWIASSETGAVAIEVAERGERVMRSARGANEALSPEVILTLSSAHPAIVHLTGYALLGPFGLDILTATGQLARKCRATLSFDPSSRGVIHRFGRAQLLRGVAAAGVDLLLPNSAEAEELTGAEDVAIAIRSLAAVVPSVVVKAGPHGAAYGAGGEVEWVPVTPVRPVDTTGAGDSFNAGVLAARFRKESWHAACAQGHDCARRVLRSYGGRPPRA